MAKDDTANGPPRSAAAERTSDSKGQRFYHRRPGTILVLALYRPHGQMIPNQNRIGIVGMGAVPGPMPTMPPPPPRRAWIMATAPLYSFHIIGSLTELR